MSFKKRRKKEVVELTSQLLHPERLLMLGGAWLAMVTMGVLGMSALVHPERRLPLIDPLLEAIADMKQQEHIFAPAPEDEKADTTSDLLSAIVLDASDTGEPAEYLGDVESLVSGTPDVAAVVDEISSSAPPVIAIPPTPAPVPQDVEMPAQNEVPTWIYLAIALSCISGSSAITLFLYKLTAPKSQKSPPAQQFTKKTKLDRAPSLNIPVIAVPPIAPLKISTPQTVKPPALKIEPIVDPQPVELPKRSRADYLAQLAHNAKQQRPKRLVDVMDVRRRNHLAPFS